MVFEGALALVLEKVLSKYVENFERDKLKVGLWGGNIVLSHLKLKQTALDELDLPVRCCYGYLENLILKIPWKNIYNEPCIAEIDGFYLLAVPNQHVKYNEEQEKKYNKEAKTAELEKVETAKKKALEKELPSSASPEQKGFFEKLAANIIKNIQINIKNIHIRYEDRISNLGKPFSIGITLNSLAIKSIPSWGEPLTIDPLNLIYKELSINWLCVYWNSELKYSDLYFINIGSEENQIKLGLQNTIGSDHQVPSNFKYLLGPINAKANLRINTKPEEDGTNFTVPKFLLRLDLEKLYIRLSKRQYQDITCFLSTLDYMSKAALYRKFRPQLTVKGNAREWWKFAYNCIVEQEIRRVKRDWDWNHMLSHRVLVKEYLQVYREKLLTPKPSKDLLARLETIEDELDVFNIVLARQMVEMEFTKEQLLRLKSGGPLEEKKSQGGWLSSWFGGGKKVDTAEDALEMRNIGSSLSAALTEDEKMKMFQAIGYNEGEPMLAYPESYIEADLGATVHEITLEFIDEKLEHPTVMTVSLQKALTSIKQWPTLKGLRLQVSVSEFIVHGIEQSKSQPKLITRTFDADKGNPLLQVLFEINPMDKKVDKRAHVFTEPLSIIYDAKTINAFIDVFQSPSEIPSAIQVAAQEKLAEFKQVSSLGLQHMLEVRETIEVKVGIKASRLFIPQGGFYQEGQAVIVVTLGNITVNTLPRSKYVAKDVATLSAEESFRERKKHSYDNFVLRLSDLQVVYAMKGEKWDNPVGDMYFLKPTSLDIDFGKCILMSDPNMPKVRVKAQLPMVEISIYEIRLKDCLGLLMSIPFPKKDEPTEPQVKGSRLSLMQSLAQLDIKDKSRPITKQDPLEEVVQFFDMECTFELQEIRFAILTQPKKNEITEFLQFRLLQLGASMDKYSFYTSIRLTLSSILLQQKYESNWIDTVFTPTIPEAKESYLFRVNITMVEKNSPELHTKYKSILQLIDVDFTKLEILFHCEALRDLKNWTDDFLQFLSSQSPSIEDSSKTSLQVRTAELISDSISELKASTNTLNKIRMTRSKPTRVDFVLMKLNGVLGEISINLWEGKERFASLGIAGGACVLTLKKPYTMFEMTLNGIYMNDHTPNTIYSKVLKIKDEKEMMIMKVVSFTETDKHVGSVDLTVDLKLARLQFIFINAFLMKLLGFLNHFSEAREKIADASQAAAEAAKQNMKNMYENAIRIGLNVDLTAPLIVVPVNKHSREAFTLDLGHITAKNSFLEVKVPNSQEPAVLDRLKVTLESLKFCRVMFDEDMEEWKSEEQIIQPISFKLTIQRNLSSGWFLDIPDLEIGGKLQTIRVSLTRSDYQLLMKTLAENLGDSGPSKAPPKTPVRKTVQLKGIDSKESKMKGIEKTYGTQTSIRQKKPLLIKEENVRATLKFALTLDSVILELLDQHTKKKGGEKKEGLAQVTLELLSVKGSMMSDESLHVALILLDCIMDDVRPSRANKIQRYMERKKDLPGPDGDVTKSMVDITFRQTSDERFADIRISSFVLMLNVEHLGKISSFFTAPPETEVSTESKSYVPQAKQAGIQDTSKLSTPIVPEEKVKLTLNFKCEHPDIVLVEHLDSIDTNAIMLDFEMTFSMRNSEDKTVMHGSINELQLFSCCYNPEKRNETKCPILNPLSIILAGVEDNGTMKIDLDSTRIKLTVTPGTISLLSSIGTAVTAGSEAVVRESEARVDLMSMWDVEDFHDSDYSFLKTELAAEAFELLDKSSPQLVPQTTLSSEICSVKFPEIILVLESGSGRTTMPILFIESFFEATVSNWSSALHLEGKFMTQMKYFNHRHALWEPLIEPVPVLENASCTFLNWTLGLVVEKNTEDDLDSSVHSFDEERTKKPLMSVSINSPEILNLTVTKRSLEILQTISTIISDAIYKPETYAGEKSPYIVKNDSGMTIKVLLDEEFVVFPKNDDGNDIKDILLDVNSSVGLSSCTEIEYLGLLDETKEKYIHVVIPTYECDIQIPVMKAAKRFFPLNQRSAGGIQWGLVSDVTVVNGQTVVTLRGIIQVENSFNMPVNIYSMVNKENELHLIGTVEPQEKINIPIDAIYTTTSELFFSVEGYTVSIVPFIWKELINSVHTTKILRCNPKGEDEQARGIPLFLRAAGEMEQIYFANTNRHTITSRCYNISIRPTVIFKNTLPVDIIVCMEGIVGEHLLTPAQTVHVPTAEPGVSHLVVRIPNYLDREWSSKNLLEETPNDLNVWTFTCYESSLMKMELGAHVSIVNGSHIYSLYCPFWMVNKTGLNLAYKQGDDGQQNLLYHPADFNGTVLFSFKAKSFFAKKKSSIRIEEGPWSDKFSLDATETSGIVICKHNNKTYHIGVQIHLINNALTKEVLFTPFHVLINNHKQPIEVREVGNEKSDFQGDWVLVESNDCLPFWPSLKLDVGRLQVRIAETSEHTDPFPYYKSHNSVLKLKNKYGAINVDVHLSDGGVFVSFFSYELGMAPVLLVNHTNHIIDVCEKTAKDNGLILNPKQKALFTWGSFDDTHSLSFCMGKYTGEIKEDSIGNFTINTEVCYWSTFLYGLQRVFLFTDSKSIAAESINLVDYEQVNQDVEVRIHGLGISLVDDTKKTEILYISISGSEVVWESKKAGKKAFKRFSEKDSLVIENAYQDWLEALNLGLEATNIISTDRLKIDFKNMRLLYPSQKEIRRTYVEGLWANIKTSDHLTRLHLKVNRLQIDQQVYDCIFPVVLAPVPPPKSVMADQATKPFIEASIIKLSNQYSYVQQFKYIGILIQEFQVKVDSGFITNLMSLFEESVTSDETQIKIMESEITRTKEALSYFVSTAKGQEMKNYYGKLHLSPLKIHLSFSLSGGDTGEENKSSLPPVVSLVLRSFGVTLTDVHDVIFQINCFQRESLLMTQAELTKEVQSHYMSQILQQLYVFVLGLDVIGNPFGLLVGFKQGATDLFYEPFQGAIRGPGEFAEGLVFGVRSLVGHTVGGTAGAISKMTGAMGKGLAALTFDDDYQRQRREAMRHKPSTMQEGLARSGKGLVMGVVEGIGGVITKPLSGAKEDGVSGFFKGFGKGVVGLVTRPTAGIVDFASGSLGAVRRVTEVSHEAARVRSPRYIRPDGVVRPYSPREAEGNRFLQELEKGKYSKTDEYVFHMDIGYSSKHKDVLLLTDRRILYLGYNDIFGGHQLEWEYKWVEITKGPEIVAEGVRFWIAQPKSLKSMFSSPDNGKTLLIDIKTLQMKLASLMTEYIMKETSPSTPTSSLSEKKSWPTPEGKKKSK